MQIGISTSITNQRGTRTLSQLVRSLLRRFSPDSHMYQAGEMVPVLGPELVATNDLTQWTTLGTLSAVTADGITNASGAGAGKQLNSLVLSPSKKYQFTLSYAKSDALTLFGVYVGGPAIITGTAASGTLVADVQPTVTGSPYVRLTSNATVSGVICSIREILSYTSQLNGFTSGNYANSTGSTVATIDQPVGLVLDAAGSVGSELVTSAVNASPWYTKGALAAVTEDGFTNASGGGAGRAIAGILDITKTYRATVSFTKSDAITTLEVAVTGATPFVSSTAASGVITGVIKPTGTEFYLRLSGNASLSNLVVSLKEITGLHASNATTAQQPKLRRGIVNLLTWSNDLTNAGWAKIGSSVASSKLVETSANSQHYASQSFDAPDGAITFAVRASAAERNWISIYSGVATHQAYFNVSSGAIGTVLAGASASIQAVGDGSYICAITSTQNSVSALTRAVYVAQADGATTYAGDGVSGIYIHSSGLFQGTLTASQIPAYGGIPLTTTASASSSLGPRYWEFDGSDDRLALQSVPFQMSDDHCVVVAASINAVGIEKYVFSNGNSSLTAPLAPYIVIKSNGTVGAYWRGDDNVLRQCIAGSYSAGQVVVVSARKIGDVKQCRINGGAWVTDSNPIGTTTLNTSLIGSSAQGGGIPNGNIYDVIPIKGTLNDSEVSRLEQQAAKAAGGYLQSGQFISKFQ